MGLEVEELNEKLTFSSKYLTWSGLYRHNSLLFYHVAWVPSCRVPDFFEGEESNPDAPYNLLLIVMKPLAQRDNAHMWYEI